MDAHGQGQRAGHWQGVVAAGVLVALVFAVGWPVIDGDWGRDDYFQLALARMVGSPWPLFTSDHYPVPGAVFRPLGFASMWLDTWLFGSSYPAHAVADLALHALVALALFALLRRAGVGAGLALLAALAFALHPVALGPAAWWSARFDVLATLFVLLALQGAWAWHARPRAVTLAAALGAALAAMASKEIGLVAVAALVATCAYWGIRDAAARRRVLGACIAAALVAVAFLVWRARVLGTAGSGLLGGGALSAALGAGLRAWLHDVAAYLSWAPRLEGWQRGLLALGALLLAACCAGLAALRWRGSRAPLRADAPVRRAELVIGGLCLLLLPALLQAPIAMLNAAPLRAGDSAVEAAMQSRLYYLGMAGVAMLLGALLGALRGRPRQLAAGATLLLVLALGNAAHDMAREFAARSWQNAASARAAVVAVDALSLAATPCRIVFLGAPQPPEWGGFVPLDGIVKALAHDREDIARCWIFEDMTRTWFHLQDAAAQPPDALPWTPLVVDGVTVPWLRVGALTYAYVVAPPALDPATLTHTHFLRWQDGRFEDVGAAVAAGRVTVPRWGDAMPARHN